MVRICLHHNLDDIRLFKLKNTSHLSHVLLKLFERDMPISVGVPLDEHLTQISQLLLAREQVRQDRADATLEHCRLRKRHQIGAQIKFIAIKSVRRARPSRLPPDDPVSLQELSNARTLICILFESLLDEGNCVLAYIHALRVVRFTLYYFLVNLLLIILHCPVVEGRLAS